MNKLKTADIEFECKSKGMNFRLVEKMEDVFWFYIYVKKDDLNKAKDIIANSEPLKVKE